MSGRSKVVWSEGLFLRPQHFQQNDRYLEYFVENRCSSLRSDSWGFTEVKLDRDLLSIGKFGLSSAAGVFPDGTPFVMPDEEPLPEPLDVDRNTRDQVVFLGVPVRRPGSQDIDRDESADGLARYQSREVEVRDVVARNEASAVLEVASLHSKFLLQSEPRDEYACIPVAEIVECRDDKQVVLQDKFIPTVLDCGGATRLASFLSELQGLLHQRGEALAGRVSASGSGGAAEIADFLLLQAVNRYEPLVNHLAGGGLLHPEDFYRFCVAAAGELCTFTSATKRPPTLASYRHDQLQKTFEPVMAALRDSLSAVLEQGAIPIPIKERKYGVSVTTIPDRSLYNTASFVLAASADMPNENLRNYFPAQVKIGPVEQIRDLVNSQLPGIAINSLPVAPRQIPYHSGYVYFELDRSSALWGQLANSGGIAFHVGGEFPGLKMEFWAIRGQ